MTAEVSRNSGVRIALWIFAAFATALLFDPLYRMGLRIELPNEGWSAVHAAHAFGADLYPPRDAFFINNYPPLWFYLLGALQKVFGDFIFPGRAVAFFAFLATAAAIFCLLRRLNAGRAAACVGALTFIGISAGLLNVYVGLSEPQMLAHALVTTGTAILVGAKRPRGAIMVALVIAVGLCVKHIVIALPLASAIWLYRYRRDLFWPYALAGFAACAAALAALLLGYGAPLVGNFLFPRVLTTGTLLKNLALISKTAVPMAVYVFVASKIGRARDPAMSFAGLAIMTGLLVIVLFGAALGVSINIVFDLVIASSIALGVAWDRIGTIYTGSTADRIRIAAVAAVILRIAIGAPQILSPFDNSYPDMRAKAADMRTTVDLLKTVPDPVLCEALSTCVWAGHVSAADLWKLRHETTLGPYMNTHKLLTEIAAGQFGAVVTFGDIASPQDDKKLAGLSGALNAAYRAAPGQTGVYLPKGK